ncbi:MAG: hypothetical protein OWU84_11780 [Firmicutes bacterium]|nr:hypothetical protein [Bacillota bacterium]
MSNVTLEIRVDGFDDYPIRLDADAVSVQGHYIATTIDISRVAQERGRELGAYIARLDDAIQHSKFRIRYWLRVQGVEPPALSADLSRIHFVACNFESTDFTGSTIGDGISLERCLIDPSLPPITVNAKELFRYPPAKAAKELGITSPKDHFVLRWGLTQDARHLGQAFLWLEKRYPNTHDVLARLLRGLPARPARRTPWRP